MTTRNLFLRKRLAVAAGALTLLVQSAPGQQAKHIILFVGDGMHLEAEIATSRYLYGRDTRLSFQKLPYKGVVSTWDVTTYNKYGGAYDPAGVLPNWGYDPVRGGLLPYPIQTSGIDNAYFIPGGGKKPNATDSASAATAWATGYKTDDGNIAWLPGDPAGGALPTIAEILRAERGFSIGVVSTVPFTHATPAAHVSHNKSRGNYHAIADEIVMTIQPEVVIGGGYGSSTYVSPGALSYLTANPASPYLFAQRQAGVDGAASLLAAAEQAAAQGRKLFGLYGDPAGGNFESPLPQDSPGAPQVLRATTENPLLKDAVAAALKVLSRDPDGFFVMFEQGDIDWAAHANDFRRIVGTTWDLHQAVKAAIDYVNQPGDQMDWDNTLLLVTSDHANSFLRLNNEMGAGDLPAQTAPSVPCPDGGGLCPAYPDGQVTFSTTNHTNELVRLYGMGPAVGHLNQIEGAWYRCSTIIDNTQLFHFMLSAAGVPRPSPLNVVPNDAACDLRKN